MNSKLFYCFTCIAVLLNACKDDGVGDDPAGFPPLDKGEIEVNRYFLTLTPSNNPSQIQIVEFYDPDGIAGSAPIVEDTLFLIRPPSSTFRYNLELALYKDDEDVTENVVDRGTLYIICYRDFNTDKIRIGNYNEDNDGLVLGTRATLSTLDEGLPDNGRGNLRVTLNYQPSGKEGLCDPGVRTFEGSIPYQIN